MVWFSNVFMMMNMPVKAMQFRSNVAIANVKLIGPYELNTWNTCVILSMLSLPLLALAAASFLWR